MTAHLTHREVPSYDEDLWVLDEPVPAEEPVVVREYLAEHIVLGYN
ncbi:hypothetical protein [Amycolatopsis samaneae]|uniref:Uncharacterized protein n=1 Tax=Amycolatopsis samaneae TaxID=664691 RepID=A0ABW5GUM0_9PSEU